jgi:hypothetical protein
MSNLSSEMQEVLAQVAKEFETAEVFSQWTPPDGTYTVLISGYNDGVSTKGNAKTAWWKLDNRIIDQTGGDLNEKEFSVFFRSSAVGFLKGAMATLAGRKIDDVRQAATVLGGAKGYVVTIRVKTNDKGFANYTYLDVVQRPDVA